MATNIDIFEEGKKNVNYYAYWNCYTSCAREPSAGLTNYDGINKSVRSIMVLLNGQFAIFAK